MNVLLIGSGGREHALAAKICESPKLTRLYAIPGNPGIGELATCLTAAGGNADIVNLAKEKAIDLVVIGPEAPLAAGLADELTAAGIKVFGPTAKAAQIESSKKFAKDLMKEFSIPTAAYETFTDAGAAKGYIKEHGAPIVIKADGLAAGKGVVVAETVDVALAAIDNMMGAKNFGAAGETVVVEEFMRGEEASLLAFTDGETVVPMLPAQDHKRIFDGDRGANTGGMGAYAPAPVMTAELVETAMNEILRPTVAALKAKGYPYCGCLYAGLMITATGPKVVEFNARFGDPETQAVLPLLESDLTEIMLSCAEGKLSADKVRFTDKAAACVIMASAGYPGDYAKGAAITGIDEARDAGCLVFHAGTTQKDGELVTSGGRVLGVTAVADDISAAVRKAYEGVEKIHFDGAYYRRDIAHRALRK